MPHLQATESDFKAGKAIHKKANCTGCRKWHGKGGGGYGGVALSLRTTQLDKATLALVIRCGRPGTGMPYHNRKAYRGDNRTCYENTKSKLGAATTEALSRSGYIVAIGYSSRREPAEELAQNIIKNGGRASIRQANAG